MHNHKNSLLKYKKNNREYDFTVFLSWAGTALFPLSLIEKLWFPSGVQISTSSLLFLGKMNPGCICRQVKIWALSWPAGIPCLPGRGEADVYYSRHLRAKGIRTKERAEKLNNAENRYFCKGFLKNPLLIVNKWVLVQLLFNASQTVYLLYVVDFPGWFDHYICQMRVY